MWTAGILLFTANATKAPRRYAPLAATLSMALIGHIVTLFLYRPFVRLLLSNSTVLDSLILANLVMKTVRAGILLTPIVIVVILLVSTRQARS